MVAAGLLAGALPFAARTETFPDCAKIEDPFAYNRCLASHGPAAGEAHVVAAPEGVEPSAGRQQGAYGVRRARNGRMSATITVEPAKPRSGKTVRPSSMAF
jgi:hypothetical protein